MLLALNMFSPSSLIPVLNISAAVLAVVFLMIAIRNVGGVRLQIWQIMLLGAMAVLVTGQIGPREALMSINLDVMIFLWSMFTIGQAMQESGYLLHLSARLFGGARTKDQLVLLILFGFGSLSALLMNDTLAIIGTPMVIYLARKHQISPKLLLLALAFAVTTGSAMSPIGNPQNLLIAVGSGLSSPFATSFQYLFLPTAINLFLAYALLKLFYRDQFKGGALCLLEE
jgi:Na+/H+ antiporter NhaD/arsenite permease-like protein